MTYTHRQQAYIAVAPVTDLLSTTVDFSQASSSCFSLLSAFATRIATPELNEDERMEVWEDLIQTLKEDHSSI